jgi:hypothetical protein
MKLRLLLLLGLLTGVTGCSSTLDDAAQTPVGGVLSGRTDTASDYLQNVQQQNQQQQPYQSPGMPGPGQN